MRTRLRRPWLFGPLLLLACAQPPDISGDIETYANTVTEANALTCDCPQLVGYAGKLECDEALGSLGTDERQCLKMVLDGHEQAASEYLACANTAYQTYVDCLELNLGCEQTVYDDCTVGHEAALASCPQLQVDVQSAFGACTM